MVTFTSDFGLTDHYVGTVKMVLARECPGVQVIDITHELPPFSLIAGAYALAQAVPFGPDDGVHLVVVDPGVGTSRRALAVESDGQHFIAPDNGVLTLALRGRAYRAYAIDETKLGLNVSSATFHGRDLFAPVAGRLRAGRLRVEDVGPQVYDLVSLDLEPADDGEGRWRGQVLSVDRFGNVITNLPAASFCGCSLQAGGVDVRRWAATFGEAAPGEIFLYVGSSGFMEIGMNRASAAERCRLQAGDEVVALTDVV